ncbi:SH2 domain-containing adapter protein B [Parasteatoda tepidariorum]|uniref:SH2 domain-containing adapter protein B n=1 Tax=Parasteatoda tepidariorum TaxID=114398 RepID=UPI000A2C084E|nr:SH2 domain-containing adapter protein B [Parasteatoda tepidariorum]
MMAKILKHFVFGQKKNPPAPPRPDYQGEQCPKEEFLDHDYENIPKFGADQKKEVVFQEKKKPELVVFENYSEPADLLREIVSNNTYENEDCDPLYMSPVDDVTPSPWTKNEEEDMYCVPYEDSEDVSKLPSPCMGPGRSVDADDSKTDSVEDTYDVVPDDFNEDDECLGTTPIDSIRPGQEYDEPWEWSVGARLTSSLQVTPSSPGALSLEDERTFSEPAGGASSESLLSDSESGLDEDEMTARQRRLYETAFDSRVKRDAEDLDRLMQSPVLQGDLFHNRTTGENGPVVRAASRSSFGSTSGSSASSTPTHQPMVIARDSPRQRHLPLHFTPTERRKVTLIRDHLPVRSLSPQARVLNVVSNVEPLTKELNRNGAKIVNTCYERKIVSFNNQWDNVSRCSSDKSSSQESMNVVDPKEEFLLSSNNSKNEQQRNFILGKSSSRDNLLFRDDRRNLTANYPSNWKELSNARLENSNDFQKNDQDNVLQKEDAQNDSTSFVSKKPIGVHSGVKVLPTDNTRLGKSKNKVNSDSSVSQNQALDPELKENNVQNIPSNEDVRRKVTRPSSLFADVRPLDNVPQSPDNDLRPSEEYDPPWEFKPNVLRPSVNGSISVPERLSQPASNLSQLSSSVTHDKLESESQSDKSLSVSVAKALPTKPTGLSSRPNLNLNLNLNSDSPRKARQNLSLNFGCAALSAVGEKVDAELTLEKQGWYHGSISRQDAENLLRVLKEGSYLVRNSESSKQDYSLSLKSARGFMHMKIVHSDGRFILGQFSNPFSSIPEMIHHYSINKLPIKGAEHMSLLYPVIDQLL